MAVNKACTSRGKKRHGKFLCRLTEARNTLQDSLEADLLQPQVAVPEQTTPQEHPVQAGAVVHDDHTSLTRNEAIACDHHFHPEHQLQ